MKSLWNKTPCPAWAAALAFLSGWSEGPGLPSASAAPASAELSIQVSRSESRLEITRGNVGLLTYVFAPTQFKPYVKALRTLQGDDVVRDAPPDHLHHHGLMYAIRVNGHNFWEERDHPGYQRPIEVISARTERGPAGQPTATFVQRIHWVTEENKDAADTTPVALLIERRTLTLTVDEANEEVALRWESEFEPGPSAGKVTLAGADYHGLGLRLPASFDKVARHSNSQEKPYQTADQRDVMEARWSAVAGRMGERDVMVACLGRPADQRGPLRFFTMLEPFAYLSATQGLDLTPQEYGAGEKWKLAHLVLVYSSHKSREFLEQRYRTWEKAGR